RRAYHAGRRASSQVPHIAHGESASGHSADAHGAVVLSTGECARDRARLRSRSSTSLTQGHRDRLMSTANKTALVNGRVLIDDGLVDNRCVLIDGERIVDIVESNDPRCAAAQKHDLGGKLLLPGFIDLQVNGGGGVLFNDVPSVESICAIGAAHC